MKKTLLFAVALFLISNITLLAEDTFNKDKSNLNVGVGFGSALWGDPVLPPISASYEIGWPSDSTEVLQKASIGGYVGFSMTESEYSWGIYSYTHIIVGARGSYHFYNTDNLDLYAGGMIGYNIVSSSYESKSSGYTRSSSAHGSEFSYAFFAGGRYYFTDTFGAFAELGYGVAYLNFGLTVKL